MIVRVLTASRFTLTSVETPLALMASEPPLKYHALIAAPCSHVHPRPAQPPHAYVCCSCTLALLSLRAAFATPPSPYPSAAVAPSSAPPTTIAPSPLPSAAALNTLSLRHSPRPEPPQHQPHWHAAMSRLDILRLGWATIMRTPLTSLRPTLGSAAQQRERPRAFRPDPVVRGCRPRHQVTERQVRTQTAPLP